MEPIFQTSFVWEKVILYPTHLIYRTGLLAKETSIPLSEISSIDSGLPAVGRIIIETTGGKKIKITVKVQDKQKLIDLIYSNKVAK